MSKIQYLVITALCLQLAGCSYLKNVQLLSGGKLKKQDFVEAIPFTLKKDIIVVKAKLGNDTTNYEFILDIGAFNSKVEKQLAEKLGYHTITTKTNSTASGVSREIEVSRIDSITLGTTSFYNISAGKVVYDETSYSPCVAASGIIGANLLKLAYWKIDYEKQLIYFSDKAFKLPDNTLSIPFDHPLLSGTPKINLKVGKHEVKNLMFDIGYNGGLILPASLKDSFEGDEKVILDNATRGIYGGKIDTLYEKHLTVQIDSFQTDIPVSFSSNNKALLGNAFLKHFDIYIDYKKDVISLLARMPVNVDNTISFIPSILNDSSWIVNRTSLNSPLNLGDTLTLVQGKKPNELFHDKCDYFLRLGDFLNDKVLTVQKKNGEIYSIENK